MLWLRIRAHARWKIFGIFLYLAGLGLYLLVQHLTRGRATIIPWTALDRAVPVMPWLVPGYLMQLALVGLPFAFIGEFTRWRRAVLGLCAVSSVSLAIFVLWPTTVLRPAMSDAWIRFLEARDAPGNACPSLHAACAVYAVMLLHGLRVPRLGLSAAWAWVILVLVSCVSLRQHTVMDLAAGASLGAAVGWCVGIHRTDGLSPLRHPADLRALLTLFAAAIVFALQWSGVVRSPLCWAASVVLVYQTYLINHNHQHLPIFREAWANHSTSLLLTLASGLPASLMVLMHNRNHHRCNNGPEDYMATSCAPGKRPWLRLIGYPIAVAFAYAPYKRRILAEARLHDRKLYTMILCERSALIAMFAILFVLRPVDTLWALLLPWALGQYWVVNANFLQHDGCDPMSQRRHSRTITSRWVNWITFNGGYHLVHHDEPGLHWSSLPVTHAVRRAGADADMEYRSFLRLLWHLACGRQRRMP